MSSPNRLITIIVSIVVVVAGLLWWQWPVVAGDDSRIDVALVTDGFLSSTERPITYRIHEDGRSLRWNSGATSWCDAADAVRHVVADLDPAAIVLSFGAADGCDAAAVTDAVHAAVGHRVLIVEQPGRSGFEGIADLAGATLIDPSRFVGDQPLATSLPCQWWDTCAPDGTVEVRLAGGSLTQAGGDRIARLIVAQLP